MKMLIALFAGFALVPSGATASAKPSVAGQTPYERLAEAIASDTHRDESLNAMLAITRPYFEEKIFGEDEEVMALERQCPGTLGAGFDAMVPEIRAWIAREFVLYRKEMAVFFSGKLAPEDAVEAAEFFDSDLGRNVMRTARQSITIENAAAMGVFGEASEEEGPDLGLLAPDIRNIAAAMIPEERDRIFAIFRSTSWDESWDELRPELLAMGSEREEAGLDETLGRALPLVEQGVMAHIASCDALD